jgi:hypothetical protein
VKDGSGALYCFALWCKTIKAGTNSLTRSFYEGARPRKKVNREGVLALEWAGIQIHKKLGWLGNIL